MAKSASVPQISGSKITVVGGRRSGVAAALLLARNGAVVFVTESGSLERPATDRFEDAGISFETDGHSALAFDADLVVISPGVPSTAPVIAESIRRGIPVVAEIEAASWFCRAPILAVTGSNGKTTTTALLGHILKNAGKRVHVAGNIGLAFSAVADDAGEDDFVVLEVSSFQLDHITTFRPKVSLLLNITPDHLDRYGNELQAYARSKYRIMENQRDRDTIVFNADDPLVRAGVERTSIGSHVTTIPFSLESPTTRGAYVANETIIINLHGEEERLMQVKQVALRGRHNLYDSLAAAVAARVVEIRSEIVRESLASFEGVPHRLELIRTVSNIKFVNDSKATNVNSLWYALESFNEPVVLIAGGRDKGNDYSSLTELVKQKVRAIVAIGESSDKVLNDLGTHARESVGADSLEQAVEFARALAQPGDAVLLSPACASFDMFDDYMDRGETFRQIVEKM